MSTEQEKEAKPLKVKKPSFKEKREDDAIFKVDLSKPKTDAIPERKTEEISMGESSGDSAKVDGGLRVDSNTEESKEVEKEEVTITEEVKKDTPPEIVTDTKPTIEIPENIEKVIGFMKDTGGTLEDYVRLNADYSQVDPDALLREYYKKTKPHLSHDEIDFHMQDRFSYDEDVDEERDVKRKQLAVKEEIAKAKTFLEETKSKYYAEIKLRPGTTQEQQKALDFYNKYNQEKEAAEKHHETFKTNTNNYFNDKFEGFKFNIGDKNFSYNVSNPNSIAEQQSNMGTFLKKFLNKDGAIEDYQSYHKAMYAANNIDSIAEHFYEQGKADATKNIISKSKNINQDPRPQETGDIFIGGLKVKAVNGVDSSRLKVKYKNKNKK